MGARSTPTPTTTIAVFAGTRVPWVQPASQELAFLSSQMETLRLDPSRGGPQQAALRLLLPEEERSMAPITSLEAVLPTLEIVTSKQSR